MNSYWIESTENEIDFDKLENNIETDVCVIGGGISGISIGYMLSVENVKTVILEKDKISSKVTGNTTAKITSQHGLIYKYLIESFGKDFAKGYLDANEEAIENIANIIQKENIECGFKKQDAYIFTQDPTKVNSIREEVEAVKSLGKNAEFVDQIPLNINILGAIRFKDQAMFNARKYTIELAKRIIKYGNCIYENSKVERITKNGDRYVIKVGDSNVIASKVVIATHFPIKDIPGLYFTKMYQDSSYIIGIETNENTFEGMYISSDIPTLSIRNVERKEGRLTLIGGSNHKTGDNNNNILQRYTRLENFAKKLFTDANIKYRWNTEDTITLDKIPYIGQFSKMLSNMYVATGYKKWGMTSSNVAANIICDMIIGKENKYMDIFTATRSRYIKNRKEFGNNLKQSINSLFIEKLKVKEQSLESIGNGKGAVIRQNGKLVGVYKDEEGKIFAVKPVCSHLGCLLTFNELDKTWDCPCHGSRFDIKGNSIYAPSVDNIEVIDIDHSY